MIPRMRLCRGNVHVRRTARQMRLPSLQIRCSHALTAFSSRLPPLAAKQRMELNRGMPSSYRHLLKAMPFTGSYEPQSREDVLVTPSVMFTPGFPPAAEIALKRLHEMGFDLPRWFDLSSSEETTSPVMNLELGSGWGQWLLSQAAADPRALWVGVEAKLHRVRSTMGRMAKSSTKDVGSPRSLPVGEKNGTLDQNVRMETLQPRNVRLAHADARLFVHYCVQANSVDNVFLLYPEPWPRKKHAGRRLLTPSSVHHLARVIKPGGNLFVQTDSQEYMEWMTAILNQSVLFRPLLPALYDSWTFQTEEPLKSSSCEGGMLLERFCKSITLDSELGDTLCASPYQQALQHSRPTAHGTVWRRTATEVKITDVQDVWRPQSKKAGSENMGRAI